MTPLLFGSVFGLIEWLKRSLPNTVFISVLCCQKNNHVLLNMDAEARTGENILDGSSVMF